MGLFKRKKTVVDKEPFSNRRESIKAENNFDISFEQWEKVKDAHYSKVEKMLSEREVERRKKEALVEKKKIFIEKMVKKEQEESQGFLRRVEIGQKINDKKRWELKKKDIAYRNRSIFG